ncbi:MAG TPA: glycine betaine ABC transporter substrate-binding protein [Methanomassiliicoccaceae archaeon]|nr:glycine betaine ABC transporter substrate-binding protein [Methanomassiliicoccaceae archaeon]
MVKNTKIVAMAAVAVVIVVAVAAIALMGGDAGEDELRFGYVTWDGEVASTNVLTLILEEAGYKVEMVPVDAGPLYQGLSQGTLDFTTSAWLPVTHASYIEKYGDKLDRVSVNLEGCKIGMAVPKYVYYAGVQSIADLREHVSKFDGRIVGIEPGAGVVMATERAIEEYGLDGYTLQTSSSAGMLAELKSAYGKGEWIAVTLWSPHWAFSEWEMEYLEDPEECYGGVEVVETITRKGFADEHPGAYAIIKAFNWTQEDCQSVMRDIFAEGMDEREAAQKWIDANRERVDEWIAAGKAAEANSTA